MDLIPPRAALSSYFKDLPRHLYTRLVQCRTGHGFFGEYYARRNIPEDPDCLCGHGIETRHHILKDCPIYEDYRYILEEADEDLSEEELLGKVDGLVTVAEFNEASGAFSKGGRAKRRWEEQAEEDEE